MHTSKSILKHNDGDVGYYEGLKGMRSSETVMVVIPYTFAWGEEGNPDLYIPPMENVVYKLELFEVKKGS